MPYDEAHAGAFTHRLREADAALVWVNPLDTGRSRKALDEVVREVAAAGVFVSAHPDVIAKMGVKAVLHRTRISGGGPTRAITRLRRRSRPSFPAWSSKVRGC